MSRVGLSSYNVLRNPDYKEAFGITWKFAVENKGVRAVRQMKAKAQAAVEEEDAEKAEELQRKALASTSGGVGKTTPVRSSKQVKGILKGNNDSNQRNRSFYGALATEEDGVGTATMNVGSASKANKSSAPPAGNNGGRGSTGNAVALPASPATPMATNNFYYAPQTASAAAAAQHQQQQQQQYYAAPPAQGARPVSAPPQNPNYYSNMPPASPNNTNPNYANANNAPRQRVSASAANQYRGAYQAVSQPPPPQQQYQQQYQQYR